MHVRACDMSALLRLTVLARGCDAVVWAGGKDHNDTQLAVGAGNCSPINLCVYLRDTEACACMISS